MKNIYQKFPVKIPNQPSPRENQKSRLHAIGGGRYVNKLGQKLAAIKKKN